MGFKQTLNVNFKVEGGGNIADNTYMTRLLLIDDDRLISEPLGEMLEEAGYFVQSAENGLDGLRMAQAAMPDLIILDVLMPKMDGWEVCREIRKFSVVPILMLTALGDEVDRVTGLELGADDYLTKPFSSKELIARVKALLRRVRFDNYGITSDTHEEGLIRIDSQQRLAWKSGEELRLRHREFDLLVLLVSKADTVVSRAEIFDRVWGTAWLGDTRTLDVHIRWLREKIEENPSKPRYLQTIRGIGYRYSPKGVAANA